MIGYSAGHHIYRTTRYGRLTDPVWMSGVDCNGTEDSLADCSFDGWGQAGSCGYYPACVFCYDVTETDFDIRLSGGPDPNVGRVEVYHSGYWGSVCYYDWDDRDANVTCRMLGYSAGHYIYPTTRYGSISYPVWMSGVDCNGTEDSLADCSFDGWGLHSYCDSYPANVFCYNLTEADFEIRLSGGSEPNVGRVEVYYSGYWGSVCGLYHWDDRYANVTCRMLGYSAGHQIYRTTRYGKLTDPVWMSGVQCSGTEDSLADCSFNGWGQVGYWSNFAASVFCYNVTETDFDIRLSGGPDSNVGRVEVYYSGYWGSVCGYYDWDDRDANVTCRMLGYSAGHQIYRPTRYGNLTDPVWMSGVDCKGTEDSLADCSFNGWGQVGYCTDIAASVFCYNVTETDFEIRLSGGPEPNVGRVEVYHSGYWGSVCDIYDWDNRDANVTCRMLGYSAGQQIDRTTRFYNLTDPVWMSGVNCKGSEDSLADCSFNGWGRVGYCSNFAASVFCYNVTETDFEIRLSGGPEPNVGRVEVFYSGYWGTVCGLYDWDDRDGNVTCRMLGYSAGNIIFRTTRYGNLTDPVWMAGVDCKGTEDSLADCSFDGWGQVGYCSNIAASVFCYNVTAADIEIRLSGGPEPNLGRVEVYYSGYWGSVCGYYDWDDRDATVTCRMLGYSAGHQIYRTTRYGSLTDLIWMTGVDCNGTEDSLADCSLDGWGRVGYCSNYPACVFCYNVTAADIEIRLSGGPEPNLGRVEVYYSGYWGSVCGYYDWDDRDANVTCRMLGYSAGHQIYRTTRYGRLTDPVWMAGVDCNGTEDSLADCSFDGWGRVGYCSSYPASVFCHNVTETDFDIRLSGGPDPNVGRVEVYYSGYWGSVCDSYDWDYKDASVTCRMLGYSAGHQIYRTTRYGSLTDLIWMAGVDCNGTEDSLADCSFDGWGRIGYCSSYPACVFCYNITAPDIEIRLSGGPEPNLGRVEVYYSGYWGSVCGYYDWDGRDANVTCRMLGYSAGHQIYRTTRYGSLTDLIWMAGVDCNGTEDSLADCSFDGWGRVGYCSSYPACVVCHNVTETDFDIRLSGGPDPNVGRVEVYYSGYWGSVCDSYDWDYKDASVTCRMLGYSAGHQIYRTTRYGSLTDLIWMAGVDCNGTEDSLADCSFDGWGRSDYCYSYPASVFCYNMTAGTDIDIRLSGGPDSNVGRVEVYYSGYWGSVCEPYDWDYKDASVTCRMLGYSAGHQIYRTTRYGSLTDLIWMAGVDCNGTEDSLADCSFDGWGQVGYCYSYPASVFCYNVTETDFDIRLSGGPDPNVGRVEVYYSGYWGSVCDSYDWDYKDASVTCRMLGYSAGHQIYRTTRYGSLTDLIWMAGVDCNGTEDSLADCSFDGWGRIGYCSSYPACVFCYNITAPDIEIRLSGGPEPNLGRVEVYYSGYWGSVCGYYDWDGRDANVTCRMLGYSAGHQIYRTTRYGSLTDLIWMAGVDCNGTEDSLADCSFDGWGRVGYCSSYPACVVCHNVTETDFDIRLSGGPDPNVGRVEVYYSGYWGSVCDSYDWDYKDASVTCRMLGYSAGHQIYRTTRYGSLTDLIWMAGVDCNGTEDSLADCSFDGWGRSDYCYSYPASVFCYNMTGTDIDIRLSGGPDSNVGRVEVYYSGYWGSVCGYYDWDYRDANVTCRMLGFSAGHQIYRTTRYGRLTDPVWMAGVDCNGTEDSLADCSFDGWGRVSYCSSYPASVFCHNVTETDFDIRLSGGPDPNVGRVEVYYSGYWGSVCGYNDWDYKDASVTCRMLGYSAGHQIYRTTRYGSLTDLIWMAGVDCNGTEDSLADCSFDGWGRVVYCRSYPACVFCYNATVDSTIDIRLIDGPNNYTGRVEVYYGGYWGGVCSHRFSFGDKDAAVACRMLQYSDGRALSAVYGLPYEPIWMDNVQCDGTESSLANCPFDGWGNVGYCYYQAYVTCNNVSGNLNFLYDIVRVLIFQKD
ncbi:deleted in malignant brain tumors 1 protein-like [Mizuhopecten yessoensis]|uniref:deleted in malignant brain tumors 1 protein-like n=1 Tax=Mizuhopecten yessoensis TaxID=6573 RepID=UPI000B45D76D|nr:deleted in malignant brain tumors 1 protein-like [Mizuhopecten yessoensis]